MTPGELIAEAAAAGLRLELTPDGAVMVKPRARCTPEIMERLRAAKPELIAHLRREHQPVLTDAPHSRHAADVRNVRDCSPLDPLAAAALAKLVIDRALRRAVRAEPTGRGSEYRVGVAVRLAEGGYATAVLTMPHADGFDLIAALHRASNGA